MAGWNDPEFPPPPPPPPPHVVNPWRFQAPSANELTPVLGDKAQAYLAYLALLRADPEIRVLAALLVRLYEQRSDGAAEPPDPERRP
jgi:hypothetical protein